MRRIGLAIALVLSVVASLAVEAQQSGKVWRVGFLGAETASTNLHFLEAFRVGMREHGYVEGQNLTLEVRWAEGRSERFRDLAAELTRLNLDVIVPVSTPAVRAVKALTGTIPIVSISVDPLGTGLVPSLARPGGNVTGLSITLGDEFAAKWLELLGEIVPGLSRVAVLWNPANPGNASFMKAVQAAAKKLGTHLELHGVGEPDQLDAAFAKAAAARVQGVIVFPDPLTVQNRARVVDLAAKSRLPAVYGFREFADSGGLMAYGSSVTALCRRAATYVDKILRGAKPGDLPIEQATQFEFVINLKTAKALGLTIPQTLLLRADQVIE
jgi:ABC-type uncharacterized transport system substrate-binding protein